MPPFKKRPLLALGIVAAAVLPLAGVAGWWWQGGQRQATLAVQLPPPPDLSGASDALQQRVAQAQERARSRLHARDGAGELGRVYHANGFYDEAMRCYAAVETVDPSNPKWPYWRATILSGYGDVEPAIALLERVVKLAPDYRPAWLRLGDCALKLNRFDRAATAYQQCLKLTPEDPYALLGLARIDLEAGREDAARTKLETVSQATNFQLGYDLIVSLYERAGLTARAEQIRGAAKASGAYRDAPDPWLEAIIEDCYDPYRLSVEAGGRARRGDRTDALRLLERAVELAPQDVSARFQLGTLNVELGNLAVAREHLERCTAMAEDFADGWAHLSALCVQMKDMAGANRALNAGLRNCPNSPGLHLMAARNLRDSGRIDEAANEFKISTRLRPTEPDAFIELANMLIAAGRTDEGVEQLKAALVAEPGNPAALSTLAFYSIVSGQESEAGRWLAQISRQPRVAPEVVAKLTSAYREQFGRDWTR